MAACASPATGSMSSMNLARPVNNSRSSNRSRLLPTHFADTDTGLPRSMPEIRRSHRFVRTYLVGCATCDYRPVHQHRDSVCKFEHDIHVVLDENDSVFGCQLP